MKAILTTLTVASLCLIGFAQKADARSHRSRAYVSSYLPCGTPVYSERYLIGYDRCGNPVWGTRIVRQRYRPVVRPVRHVAHCPPPHVVPCGSYRSRSGVSVSFQGRWSR